MAEPVDLKVEEEEEFAYGGGESVARPQQQAPIESNKLVPRPNRDEQRRTNPFSAVKNIGKGAITVVMLPWNFAMNDNFFNSMHMDPRTREMHEKYQEEKRKRRSDKAKKETARTRRSTNRGAPCVAGCEKVVRIDYTNYDPTESDYLICGESCSHPIAAHKDCVRKHMASSGVGRFHHACEDCDGAIHMTGRFRLSFYELPYTFIALLQFGLRHLFFMPFIMCYVWYTLLWIRAWMHYHDGVIDDKPTNPFTLRYVMYSSTDPTWTWEAHTFSEKWFTGAVFYLLIALPVWKIFLRKFFGWVYSKFNTLLWRYDV